MCGFIGKVSTENFNSEKFADANEFTVCRGPDSKKCKEGQFKTSINSTKPPFFKFIFNRLSIVDLSPEAMQPMYSKKFNSWILFNGEIFNHRELRSFLEKKGIQFQTSHSDTEVLLNGISEFGDKFIDKIIGQFAIVFYDEKSQNLKLIRDRVGQKPLFYFFEKNSISFGSNLKSLINIKNKYELSKSQINNYINFGVVPSPNTLFKNIYKLEPGTILNVDFSKNKLQFSKSRYWQIENFIDENSFDEDEFFNIFHDSVNLRLEADVPVANLLSGGIDSTSIIKALYRNSNSQINTFSITNTNDKYDESKWINQVVEKYNTNHKSSNISMDIKTSEILSSIDIFDEPYADPSTVPSYLISKAISEKYKVAISGDGGDELLGGYDRQSYTMNNSSLPTVMVDSLFKIYPGFLGSGNSILKRSNNKTKAYSSYFQDVKLMSMLNLKQNLSFADEYVNITDNLYKSLSTTEYKFYLFEMMTLKVDRTSMANSVEVRSPYLDHRLIEYILGTKNEYYDKNRPKNIMKTYLSQDFDENFLNRKKQGFVFNLEGWIFNNMDLVTETINNGKYIQNYDNKILSKLSINKSRINGSRIWKLFFLERYLGKL